MNVKIGAEAALFPEKEYINGIAVAVWDTGWKCTVSYSELVFVNIYGVQESIPINRFRQPTSPCGPVQQIGFSYRPACS
jgi:hypothetical protein